MRLVLTAAGCDMLLLLEACWRALRAEADLAETSVPRCRIGSADERADLLAVARHPAAGTALPVCAAVLLVVEAESARTAATDTPQQWWRPPTRTSRDQALPTLRVGPDLLDRGHGPR